MADSSHKSEKLVVLLRILALVSLVAGILGIAAPGQVAGQLGYELVAPKGKVEFTTFYGGFFVGVAAFFSLASYRRSLRAGAFAFLGFASTASALTRASGLALLEADAGVVMMSLLIIEIVMALIGWIGWLGSRSS